MITAEVETKPSPYVSPVAREIIARASRGEGYEDIFIAIRQLGYPCERDFIRRYVLRLPMRIPKR